MLQAEASLHSLHVGSAWLCLDTRLRGCPSCPQSGVGSLARVWLPTCLPVGTLAFVEPWVVLVEQPPQTLALRLNELA